MEGIYSTLSYVGYSDVEAGQGDVDEGFDEEFEDKDINDVELKLNQIDMADLDPKELQNILDDAQFDFDLGVDLLGDPAEQTEPCLSPASVSRASSPAYSPYQPLLSAQSKLDESFSSEDAHSAYSMESSAVLFEPISLEVSSSTSAAVTNTIQPNPVMTTAAAPGLDLMETANLLQNFDFTTPMLSDTSVDTQSMYLFGNGTGHLALLPVLPPPNSVEQTATHPSLIDHTSSLALQTTSVSVATSSSAEHYDQHLAMSPSPSPTPSPKPNEQEEVSAEDRRLIDMPYHQFRKLLEDPSLSDKRKEDIKNIRRRGRNKIAARTCRKKKLGFLLGLEQEVKKLKDMKNQMTVKTLQLEREIAQLKKLYHHNGR